MGAKAETDLYWPGFLRNYLCVSFPAYLKSCMYAPE